MTTILKPATIETTEFGHAKNTQSSFSPAKHMAKMILEELQGFNLLNFLKHSFWYFAGIIVLVIFFACFPYDIKWYRDISD
jgi:hypothetical protein